MVLNFVHILKERGFSVRRDDEYDVTTYCEKSLKISDRERERESQYLLKNEIPAVMLKNDQQLENN